MQNHTAKTALAALTAACLMQPACLGDELVQGRVAVVGAMPQALMSGELVAVDGSYGAACASRFPGSWSVGVDGAMAVGSELSVILNNTACVLTVTALRTSGGPIMAAPAIELATNYNGTASAFDSPVDFYANAKLTPADFSNNFALMILFSQSTVTPVSKIAQPIPPTVVAVSPTHNSTDLSIATEPSATFDSPMDEATFTGLTFTLTQGGTPIAGTVSFDVGSNTATFSPTALLGLQLPYVATITTGAKDIGNTGLAANYVWTFTTAEFWPVEKSITLDGAQIALAPMQAFVNFPVLIRLTDPNLQDRAAADGSDIYFVAADGTSQLNHELEAYDSVTGALVAWVRIPSLTPTDTVLYLRYADGGADRSNPSGVWGVSFKSVWHLAQDPGPGGAGDIKDSASAAAHATALANMTNADSVNAVIGRGIDFDGIDDELSFTNTFTGTGSHTISAWVNQLTVAGFSDTVISFGTNMLNQGRFLYAATSSSSTLMAGFYSNELDSGYSIADSGWRYVVWTWGGVNTIVYVDGVVRDGPVAHSGANTVGNAGRIGNAYWAARNLTGQLDELRVITSVRNQPWVTTEYNNQRPNSTFIKSVGAEQLVP